MSRARNPLQEFTPNSQGTISKLIVRDELIAPNGQPVSGGAGSAVGWGDGQLTLTDIPAGLTDPYNPDTQYTSGQFPWPTNGTPSILQVRVSQFGSAIKCLPAAPVGTCVVLNQAGDGGGTFTQRGLLSVEHMAPAYDPPAIVGGVLYAGFYCPGQRDLQLEPADSLLLRYDGGHPSWRVMAQTNSGRTLWMIPDRISLHGLIQPPALAAGNNNNYNPADIEFASRVALTPVAGSILTGMAPPAQKWWNGAAFVPWGGDIRILYNNTAIPMQINHYDAASAPEFRFICPGSVNNVLGAYQIRMCMYDNINFWWNIVGS